MVLQKKLNNGIHYNGQSKIFSIDICEMIECSFFLSVV